MQQPSKKSKKSFFQENASEGSESSKYFGTQSNLS